MNLYPKISSFWGIPAVLLRPTRIPKLRLQTWYLFVQADLWQRFKTRIPRYQTEAPRANKNLKKSSCYNHVEYVGYENLAEMEQCAFLIMLSISCSTWHAYDCMNMNVYRMAFMYIYIYYEFLFPWEWTKHGGKTTNQKPSKTIKNHASLPERLRVARLEQHNLSWEIYRINSTDCFMWDFFWAGKSWALILSKCCDARVSKFHLEFSNHQTSQLDRKPNDIIPVYIYIKAQSINSILFWKKHKSQDQPFTIYPLEIATSELAMEIGFAQRQPCKKWRQVRLLGS